MSTTGAQTTAVVTGSFLSGAMMSISLLAIPVLLDTTTGPAHLFHQWVRVYHYGHQILPTMAVGTFLLYSYTSLKKRSARKSWSLFALAGIVTLSMLPFTWLVMVPTNDELFRLEVVSQTEPLVKELVEAKELVVKWSWLHLTRSMLPLTGAIIGAIGTFWK
ncbi:hypothetical protein F5884DRAFT_856810 [Xylogone sp. PMI_703]|nr:hypothetical protein F5884DRAFT_856810 [Xylogone sp. PMI_703]